MDDVLQIRQENQRSEDPLRRILESVDDGITVQDTRKRLIYANEKAATILGFASVEELLQASISEVLKKYAMFDEFGQPFPLDQLPGRTAIEERKSAEVLLRFKVIETGEERWSLVRATPILDSSGEVQFAINIMHDVTERKRIDDTIRAHYQAEQEARQIAERAVARISRLQSITAALAGALTPEQVAEVIVDQGIASIGASAGSMLLVVDDGKEFAIVRATGYHADLLTHWAKFPIDVSTPARDALRTAQPVFIESPEKLHEIYPALVTDRTNNKAFLSIPLILEERVIGMLNMSFATTRNFSEEDHSFLVTLARQCVQALERSRLYEIEREARAEAEAAKRRFAFLAGASNVLSATLDYQSTLQSLVNLVVPDFADWCCVSMFNSAELLEHMALAHCDQEKSSALGEILSGYQLAPDSNPEIIQVLNERRSSFISPDVFSDLLFSSNESLAALAGQITFKSIIFSPLIARNRTLGIISFILAESNREYDQSDLMMAEELAHRAALAVDNARLYNESQEAIRIQKELDNLKDLFMSVTGHELRTPLTSIKGYTQMLQRHLVKQQKELANSMREKSQTEMFAKDMSYIETILHQIERMSKLIGQLLDFSRIQGGQFVLMRNEGIDFVDLVRHVIEQQAAIVDDYTLLFETQEQSILGSADETRLEQILNNLISNAIKYSASGSVIVVGITREPTGEDGNEEVVIYVRDQGIGIPAEDHAHVFDCFYRVSNKQSTKVEGLGLGLYISHEIVIQHGGRMWLESEPGKGSTFYFSLPLEK